MPSRVFASVARELGRREGRVGSWQLVRYDLKKVKRAIRPDRILSEMTKADQSGRRRTKVLTKLFDLSSVLKSPQNGSQGPYRGNLQVG
jgi:hypothetical protein